MSAIASTTYCALDNEGSSVTFTAPADGQVGLDLSAQLSASRGAYALASVEVRVGRGGGGHVLVAASDSNAVASTDTSLSNVSHLILVTGLEPGVEYTARAAGRTHGSATVHGARVACA